MNDDHGPVTVQVELADFVNIIEKAEECAQDLIAEVEANYPGDHPVSLRRKKRDQEVGDWIISAISAYRVKYSPILD